MSQINTVQLYMQDNGSSIKAQIETTIYILLPGNATTGYTWAISHIDENIVECVQSGFNNANAAAPGSASQQYFTFKPVKKGNSKIALKYFRSWQGDSSVTRTFEINIEVV